MGEEDLASKLVDLQLDASSELGKLASAFLLRGEDSVLYRLDRRGGLANASQLADDAQLTSGRIANILRSLESKNYIERSQDSSDHRRVAVSITPAGRRHVAGMRERLLGYSNRLLEVLGPQDFAELCHATVRVCELASRVEM